MNDEHNLRIKHIILAVIILAVFGVVGYPYYRNGYVTLENYFKTKIFKQSIRESDTPEADSKKEVSKLSSSNTVYLKAQVVSTRAYQNGDKAISYRLYRMDGKLANETKSSVITASSKIFKVATTSRAFIDEVKKEISFDLIKEADTILIITDKTKDFSKETIPADGIVLVKP